MSLLVERLCAFASSGRRLLAAAALLHVTLAAGLFCAGRAQIAPRYLDRDGIVVASDSYGYRDGAVRLAEILKEDGFATWAAQPEPAHVKLISVQFVFLSPLFGHGVLSAEPFNLCCYVLIIGFVYMLGREVGGRRVGLTAAAVVGLWPSFLLHTMQLLKDPLFIAAGLALILIVTTWLTRIYGWLGAIATGALAAAITALLLLIRVKFGAFILAIVFFGFVLLVVRQLIERRWLRRNLACSVLILCAGLLAPFYVTVSRQTFKQYPSDGGGQPKSVAGAGRQLRGVLSYANSASFRPKLPPTYAGRLYEATETAAIELGSARYKFNVSYPESASAIDRNVEYTNLRGLIRHLPRALAVGFWSPFPDMWLGAGKLVGSAGRILSGAETLIIYLCEMLVLVGLWRAPRSLPAWLLLSITTLGVTVLGLAVSNVGALYRFRYMFWMLLIILGVKSLLGILTARRAGTQNSLEREPLTK